MYIAYGIFKEFTRVYGKKKCVIENWILKIIKPMKQNMDFSRAHCFRIKVREVKRKSSKSYQDNLKLYVDMIQF